MAAIGASNMLEGKGAHESGATLQLMEAVVARSNMFAAYDRVMRNKGAAGVDEMPLDQLKPYLKVDWPRIKEELLNGRYKPLPVRGVEIPKPGGKGTRLLGIPAVIDRLIQQALLQILTPIFDPSFFPIQLWIPSTPKRASSRASSAAFCARRKTVCCRHGFGEVLRQGKP